jgi:hypothetical protein
MKLKLQHSKGDGRQTEETAYRMWELLASYISDKGLVNRIYSVLKKLTSYKINNSLNKWPDELSRQFSKAEVQMANKHVKKCSTSLVIKEMQIKMKLRFHLIPVKLAIINNTNHKKMLVRMGGKGTFLHCW